MKSNAKTLKQRIKDAANIPDLDNLEALIDHLGATGELSSKEYERLDNLVFKRRNELE